MAYDGPPKLVRDRIPEIIRSNGETPITHVVTGQDLLSALLNKLHEEVLEVEEAGNQADRAEELADVLELVRAIAAANGNSLEEIMQIMEEKSGKRGGFNDGIILERSVA